MFKDEIAHVRLYPEHLYVVKNNFGNKYWKEDTLTTNCHWDVVFLQSNKVELEGKLIKEKEKEGERRCTCTIERGFGGRR